MGSKSNRAKLARHQSTIAYGMDFVSKGDAPMSLVVAQGTIARKGGDFLADRGGVPNNKPRWHRGHKYGDRPKWQDRPYRTEMMTSTAKAGNRSQRARVHGASPSTAL